MSSPPSRSHGVYIYSRPIVTTCLCTSALLVVELGSCRLHWSVSCSRMNPIVVLSSFSIATVIYLPALFLSCFLCAQSGMKGIFFPFLSVLFFLLIVFCISVFLFLYPSPISWGRYSHPSSSDRCSCFPSPLFHYLVRWFAVL